MIGNESEIGDHIWVKHEEDFIRLLELMLPRSATQDTPPCNAFSALTPSPA
jgi:hypothetical protein